MNELRHLPQHLLQLRYRGIHSMRLIHSYILLPHLLSSGRVSTQSAHTHPHDILMQIGNTQFTTQQIAEQEIRVGGYLVALVIQSLLLYHASLDLTSRMQRQPPMAHLPQAVVAANPVAYHPIRALWIHEPAITIKEIGMSLLKTLYDM